MALLIFCVLSCRISSLAHFCSSEWEQKITNYILKCPQFVDTSSLKWNYFEDKCSFDWKIIVGSTLYFLKCIATCIQKVSYFLRRRSFGCGKILGINLIFKFKGFVSNEYACDSDAKIYSTGILLHLHFMHKIYKRSFAEYYYSYWRFYRCIVTLVIFMVRWIQQILFLMSNFSYLNKSCILSVLITSSFESKFLNIFINIEKSDFFYI